VRAIFITIKDTNGGTMLQRAVLHVQCTHLGPVAALLRPYFDSLECCASWVIVPLALSLSVAGRPLCTG